MILLDPLFLGIMRGKTSVFSGDCQKFLPGFPVGTVRKKMEKTTRPIIILICAAILSWSVQAYAEVVRGGAVLGSVSPVVKINKESNSMKILRRATPFT